MSRYVIYARKSSESEDRQVASIDSQIHELRLVAARRQMPIGEVLTESHSAKAPGRPIFTELMKSVERGGIRGILCWKLDRLARNHFDTGLLMQALADGKLEAVITPERQYTIDGTDRFLGSFELGMATKFIDDLRANVKRGNRARFEKGWPNYRPPIGYLEDRLTKTIVIDPLRFGIVRRMWELLLSGSFRPMQIWRIAAQDWHLTNPTHGSMGGGLIRPTSVYNLFANPFYAGRIVLRSGKSYPGAFPPMVTEEEFKRARTLIRGRSHIRPEKHYFAYADTFRCACGLAITGEQHIKGSGKRYVYYRCTRSKRSSPCRQPAVSEPELERQLVSASKGLGINSALHAWLLQHVATLMARESEQSLRVLEALNHALESVRTQQEKLLAVHLRGQISDEEFARQRQRLIAEEVSLTRRLQSTKALPAPASSFRASHFSQRVASILHRGTSLQRRMCTKAIWSERVIRDRQVHLVLSPVFGQASTSQQ